MLEQLLYVATAKGVLEWSEWKAACGSVSAGFGPAGISPSGCASTLEQLGHVEISLRDGAASVSAAPAVMTRLPVAGLPRAVLCGGRSPQTEASLREAARACGVRMSVLESRENRAAAPRALFFTADDLGALVRAAELTGVKFSPQPPAWVLANVAGSLAEYLTALQWRHEPEPALPARELNPATGLFGFHSSGRGGRRLIHYSPRVFRPYYELRDGGRAARADRDWGIWACIQAGGLAAAIHDEETRAVAIPAHIRFPRPLARMLGLCSGLPPTVLVAAPEDWPAAGRPYYVFTGIPANIAGALFDRLGHDPLPLQIPLPHTL